MQSQTSISHAGQLDVLQFYLEKNIAEFFKYQFYYVMFDCYVASQQDPSIAGTTSTQCTIWHIIYYGLIVTAGTIAIAVYGVSQNFQVRRLDEWWCGGSRAGSTAG